MPVLLGDASLARPFGQVARSSAVWRGQNSAILSIRYVNGKLLFYGDIPTRTNSFTHAAEIAFLVDPIIPISLFERLTTPQA